MTLYTQAYNGDAAGDYPLSIQFTTDRVLRLYRDFTVTDSNGIVSPHESFSVNPVDLYAHILFNDPLMKRPAQTLTWQHLCQCD